MAPAAERLRCVHQPLALVPAGSVAVAGGSGLPRRRPGHRDGVRVGTGGMDLETVVVPTSPALREYMAVLEARAEDIRARRVSRQEDIMLTVCNGGRMPPWTCAW